MENGKAIVITEENGEYYVLFGFNYNGVFSPSHSKKGRWYKTIEGVKKAESNWVNK